MIIGIATSSSCMPLGNRFTAYSPITLHAMDAYVMHWRKGGILLLFAEPVCAHSIPVQIRYTPCHQMVHYDRFPKLRLMNFEHPVALVLLPLPFRFEASCQNVFAPQKHNSARVLLRTIQTSIVLA